MNTKLQLAAIFNLVSGALHLLAGLCIFLLLTLAGSVAVFGGHAGAASMIAMVIVVVAGYFIVLSLPAMLGGWGLLAGKQWARPLLMVVSLFNLFSVPVGTAIGAYTFWALASGPGQATASA